MSQKCDACGGPGGIWPLDDGDHICGKCLEARMRAAWDEAPTVPAVPAVPLPVDDLPTCDAFPSADTFCAAGFLSYVENHGTEWVPSSDPVLCAAHEARMVSELLRLHPGLLAVHASTRARIYEKQRDMYRAAALRQAARAAEKLGREQ